MKIFKKPGFTLRVFTLFVLVFLISGLVAVNLSCYANTEIEKKLAGTMEIAISSDVSVSFSIVLA